MRTSGGSRTWLTGDGLTGAPLFAVAIDSLHPWTVYAGGDDGVSRSRDGGAAWMATGRELVAESVRALAIDPRGTVYAAGDGLARSTDGCESWIDLGLRSNDPVP